MKEDFIDKGAEQCGRDVHKGRDSRITVTSGYTRTTLSIREAKEENAWLSPPVPQIAIAAKRAPTSREAFRETPGTAKPQMVAALEDG